MAKEIDWVEAGVLARYHREQATKFQEQAAEANAKAQKYEEMFRTHTVGATGALCK
jgi:hypothetical protein